MSNSSMEPQSRARVFTSFDFEHDEHLRMLFVGQARNPRTPFEIVDWSVKEKLPGNWKEKVRERIRRVDKVVVLCGEHTDKATGVSEEVRIAREEGKPCYFIKARPDRACKLPKAALPSDRITPWTWDGIAGMMRASTPHHKSPPSQPKQLLRKRPERTASYMPPRQIPTKPVVPQLQAPIFLAPRLRIETIPALRAPRVRTSTSMRGSSTRLPRIRTPRIRTRRVR